MTSDQVRALLLVGALLAGASGSASFVGGRMTAATLPAEVRYVTVPAPCILAPLVPAEPVREPAPAVVPSRDEPELPPKVEPKEPPPPSPTPPKVQTKPAAKPRAPAPRKAGLPSCAFIKRQYEAMSAAERWAAYRKATAEQIALGRRCLGI